MNNVTINTTTYLDADDDIGIHFSGSGRLIDSVSGREIESISALAVEVQIKV